MLIERIEVICYFILLIRKHPNTSKKPVESITKRALINRKLIILYSIPKIHKNTTPIFGIQS
jgi:hypothetical protein